MKKIMKSIVAMTLIAAMILSMAGCGKKGGSSAAKGTIDKNTIYKEEQLQLNLKKDMNIGRVAVGSSKIYMIGNVYDQEYNTTTYLVTCDLDGSNYFEKKMDMKGWVDNLYITPDDNVFITYNDYFEDDSDPDNYVYENYNYIAKFDAEGNKLLEKELTEELDIDYINSLTMLNDGGMIVYAGNFIYLLDADLNKKKEKELSESTWVNQFYQFKDGTVGALMWGDTGEEMKKTDLNTLEFGEKIDFPFAIDNYTLLPGNDKYDMLLRTSSAVYGYKTGDKEPTELFNFINSDIETNYFDSLSAIADGSFIGSYSDYTDDAYKFVIAKYTKIDPADYVEKKVLSIGVTYLDYNVRKAIIKYNKTSDNYRITIVDYSLYNTEDNYNGGREKLNSDIASGQGPDIIMSDDPTLISNYASKGIFVDLHKFADSDPDVNISDIWPNLLKACETDGKLYELVPSFSIDTLVGKASKLGNRTSWTLAEMREFEKSLPEGTDLLVGGVSRESMLTSLMRVEGNNFVDLSKATCNFDSDYFKQLLTYCAELKSEEEINVDDDYYNNYDSLWRSDKVALYNFYFSDLSSYKYVVKGYFGEPVSFVGYPSSDGKGSVITFWQSLAISSKCKNQEGAWDFVKFFWSKDYQENCYSIPASMSRFDEVSKSAMERPSYEDENGEVVYYDDSWWIGGTEVKLEPLTQSDVDMLKEFILSIDKKEESFGEDILNIINEEAEPFFRGQKSVDEVTQIIQSRVSIYLKEKQ